MTDTQSYEGQLSGYRGRSNRKIFFREPLRSSLIPSPRREARRNASPASPTTFTEDLPCFAGGLTRLATRSVRGTQERRATSRPPLTPSNRVINPKFTEDLPRFAGGLTRLATRSVRGTQERGATSRSPLTPFDRVINPKFTDDLSRFAGGLTRSVRGTQDRGATRRPPLTPSDRVNVFPAAFPGW